ncbi:TPA: AIPR family protein [Neisseria meningitidis]|uniref:Possible abortive infection phage resistance protein n=1 Tax=Neisseria meningitidis (strain alpha14) TaxID=662598 RepID=C6S7Z7_NEIML|nr:AIPR family protein [Neisseria meningitidis]CBA06910.1 possible abortive infection phage resistance protein [Neisseria meningitidis alpha14]
MAQERVKPLELELLCEKLNHDFSGKITGQGQNDESKRRNFLSKAIAAFVLHEETTASLDDAVSASVDGGLDHGIDAILIDSNHVIWLVQSKYIDTGAGEPELGDVSKFRDGIIDLLEGRFDRFNDAIKSKKTDIENVMNSGICKVKAILAYSGTAISDNKRDIFSDIERTFNDSSPDFIRCYAYGLSTLHELHKSCLEENSIDEEIELVNFGHIQQPYKAYYGQIKAEKLFSLWNTHKHKLVEKNIRRFKGETSVNQSLKKTLDDNPEHFFYFNNGITFLCNSIVEIGSRNSNRQTGKFKVQGLSIINGAQTVGVIGSKSFEFYQQHPIHVFATFLCLNGTPDDFSIEVTQARNRQNAVSLEDFASLDDNQIRLRDTLSIAGVTYLIKQGYDDSPDSDTCFNIRELVPLLACTVTSSDWQEYVIAAKSDKTRLFQQVALTSHRKKMKDAYQKLFSDSRTATEIWRIVQLGRIIKQIVKDRASGESIEHSVNLQAKDILNQGIWLIIHIVFLRTKLQNGNKLFITEDEKQRLSSEIDTISHKLVNVIQSEQWEKTAQAIFENQTDCNTIKNRLMAALASA